MSLNKQCDYKGKLTYIKIKTKDNMYYTMCIISWEEAMYEGESESFDSIQEYIDFITRRQIQNIVDNKDGNSLIYMYPENKAVSRDNIKEIFTETVISKLPTNK